MKFVKVTALLFIGCLSFNYFGQILDINPNFPTVDDNITIIYDASQGNAALVNESQVYMHAGLITSASTSPTNWLFVQGTWGTADPEVAMTNIGNNLHSITIDIDQFYGFPGGTEVLKLAFVFRNSTGTSVGRTEDGTDIFYDIYPNNGELFGSILSPSNQLVLSNGGSFDVNTATNISANLSLYDNGVLVSQTTGNSLNHTINANGSGTKLIEFVAEVNGMTVKDSIYYTVNPTIFIQNPPVGTRNGINYINESTVILQLYAPDKDFVYVLGDFNNWVANTDYFMNKSTDNATWWLQLNNLTPNQRYGFQYFIDGQLKLADPLSTLILDPNNDQNINNTTYPNRHPYPTGKTTGFVSVIHPGAPSFNWQHDNFVPPAKKDLMIYELLVRDFVFTHNYLTLIDTLNYLKKLGINAIELMPVGEFENNESWGYNPSFHMALDKYYGTPTHFKQFVDACHSYGIAVILDIALNHTFGQNPMVNMYWDAANNRTAINNPWFNVECPHPPFCWGFDMNHESDAVKTYVDIVNKYWLSEYHLDGFRFDYTKGFVNNANGYSDTRIEILKRMADQIWSFKPNAYVILEHWCDNSEEEQLADYGMMLWGNLTHAYQEAGMGYTASSNVSSAIYSARGWANPHLVTYIESHDEERAMFKNITFGQSLNPLHDAKNEDVALKRMQALAVTFLTTPGPKMIWQFGELGYDISIDVPCRVCNKPILWNYFLESGRRQTYEVYRAVLGLRNTYSTFTSLDFSYNLTAGIKMIKLNHTDMNALVVVNYEVVDMTSSQTFQHDGWWYEFFSGDSILVNGTANLNLAPGAYRIYTDVRLQKPTIIDQLSLEKLSKNELELLIYPNPSADQITLKGFSSNLSKATAKIIDKNGKTLKIYTIEADNPFINTSDLKAGQYLLLIENEGKFSSHEFIKY